MRTVAQRSPARCDACGGCDAAVSAHDDGWMGNVCDGARYKRVDFEPTSRDGDPCVYVYHHTRGQAEPSEGTETATTG